MNQQEEILELIENRRRKSREELRKRDRNRSLDPDEIAQILVEKSEKTGLIDGTLMDIFNNAWIEHRERFGTLNGLPSREYQQRMIERINYALDRVNIYINNFENSQRFLNSYRD